MGLLARQGLLVVEHPKAQTVELAGGLALAETRHWGGTAVSVFQQSGR
jgi:hypothetical protein